MVNNMPHWLLKNRFAQRPTGRGSCTPNELCVFFKSFSIAMRLCYDGRGVCWRWNGRLSRVPITIYKYYYRVRFRVASPFSPNKLTISAAVKYQTAVRMNYVCSWASQKKKRKNTLNALAKIVQYPTRYGLWEGVRWEGRSEGYFVSPDREKNISFLFILQKQWN